MDRRSFVRAISFGIAALAVPFNAAATRLKQTWYGSFSGWKLNKRGDKLKGTFHARYK